MAVRPFYIESSIDGRKTDLSGGPQNKEGGIYTTIYQRNEGSIAEAFKVKCYSNVRDDGTIILTTAVYDAETGECVARKETLY